MAAVGYAWESDYATLDGVTELRVHGVGGTPPEAMLFDPAPTQVAGDRTAGFWRGRGRPGRRIEAYSWGGLTSRAAVRALWVVLLPFTLANVAGWMQHHPRRPAGSQPPVRTGAAGILVRLLGLSITVLAVVGVGTISLDLVAYQCGGQPACVRSRWWLWPLTQAGLPDRPGRRLVLGAAAPLLLLGLLWYLGRRSVGRYEAVPPPDDLDGGSGPLVRPSTWDSGGMVAAQQRAHLAAGVAATAMLMVLAASALARQDGRGTGPAMFLAAAAVAVVAAATAALLAEGRSRGLLVGGAGAVLGAAALWAWLLPPSPTRSQVLPGISRTGEAVFGVELLLLGGLAVAAATARPAPASHPNLPAPAFGRAGPVVLSALAVFTAGSAIGGGMLRVADMLGEPADPSTGVAAVVIRTTPAYDWLSMLFAVGAGGGAAGLLGVVLWAGRVPGPAVDEVAAREPGDGGAADRRCAAPVARAERLAGLPARLGRPVAVTVGLVLALAAGSYLVRLGGGETLSPYPDVGTRLSWLRNGASWVVTMLPVAAAGLVAGASRSAARRRTVGILWDLGTFWPRWFHPLAPPCYTERAVPELQCRILRLTGTGGRVVLSAHSQGSVLAAVALRMLPTRHRTRVALVTYGSPLAWLYPALFPDHFPAAHRGLASTLAPSADRAGHARWRNFWRRTDPIGGPVDTGDPADDPHPLPDPRPPLAACGACAPVRGHSHYLEDEAVERHLAAVAAALAPGR